MTGHLSLTAMIENPPVFVLAQRPGPATGLPTWPGQGGLLQAANCSAGEFARCVIAVSTSQDAFDLMPVAFNLAEQYQIRHCPHRQADRRGALHATPLRSGKGRN